MFKVRTIVNPLVEVSILSNQKEASAAIEKILEVSRSFSNLDETLNSFEPDRLVQKLSLTL